MRYRPAIAGALLLLIAAAASAADPAALKFFEERVRPILADRCLSCHGPDKQKGHLRLDSSAALLKGGDRGPAIVPGKPDDSLLVSAIRHGETVQMPPKTKLPPQEIADLTAWVKNGAPWPTTAADVRRDPKEGRASATRIATSGPSANPSPRSRRRFAIPPGSSRRSTASSSPSWKRRACGPPRPPTSGR